MPIDEKQIRALERYLDFKLGQIVDDTRPTNGIFSIVMRIPGRQECHLIATDDTKEFAQAVINCCNIVAAKEAKEAKRGMHG